MDGVYAAAVTPLTEKGSPCPDQLGRLLNYLEAEGCHGALLTGTTGEAVSFSVTERLGVFQAARRAGTALRLLGGTAAASISDVITLTRSVYEAGLDAAVILPPFFYTNDLDLYGFFGTVIREAVPPGQPVLLYHNPNAISVHLTPDLVARLRDAFPERVIGIKNSASDWATTETLLNQTTAFKVLVGRDELVERNLSHGGAGAITGAANLFAHPLRALYDAHQAGQPTSEKQTELNRLKGQLSGPPRIAALKFVLKERSVLTHDAVRLPLRPLTDAERTELLARENLC